MSMESLGRYVSVIYRYINSYINSRFEPYNLNRNQVTIMHVLYDHEGISQYELGDILYLDKITVTKSLRGLLQEGYIEKHSCRKDKRVNKLYVTEKGHSIKDEVVGTLEDVHHILSEGFSEEETALARKLLLRMLGNIHEKLKK